MELGRYVQEVHHQLLVAADAAGDEAHVLAERLVAALDPAVRLTLLDALGDAAAEITAELAPGSVEVRLRAREPSFVVTPPPSDRDERADEGIGPPVAEAAPAGTSVEPGDDGQSRINLRLPTHLKGRVEQAAARDGISINAWLVRAATAAVDRDDAPPSRSRRVARSGQQFTGWVR